MAGHRSYREVRYEFGNQILTLRTRAALTQSQLAEQVGVHRRSVQNWETGESYPKAETLQRLLAVFLQHHAFTAGNEHVEAHALWSQVVQDGPQPLAPFDDAWFSHTLPSSVASAPSVPPATGDAAPPVSGPASAPAQPRAIVDWGEAMAVPTLYGREHELERLHEWIVDDRCRLVTILGLSGMGKSSLAITFAHAILSQFDVVLFRSLQNAPPLVDVLDQVIGAISDQQETPPREVLDKITLLVQLFRERRCLLILDNLEAIMQPGALAGTYHTGYAEYGLLLKQLSEREHQSCLLLASREKPAELGPLEGRTAPVRTLNLAGLPESACRIMLEAKDAVGTEAEVAALAQLFGGNPRALTLIAQPIREMFGGNVGALLSAGDVFFNGAGKLLARQLARLTPLEQSILDWLAIEREPVSPGALLSNLNEPVGQRAVLAALESLRRRMLIERAPDRPVFMLQPVIRAYVTDQFVKAIRQEIVDGQPKLLQSHALIQATAKDVVRHSQERLIATPLLEQLAVVPGHVDTPEHMLLNLLATWRDQPPTRQGYGPGNVVNLLRLLRGNLRGLDLSRLSIRQAYLRGVEAQDTSFVDAILEKSALSEAIDAMTGFEGIRLANSVDDGGRHWDLHSGDYFETLRRDRPYECMDITGLAGITAAQRASLVALGAIDRPPATGQSTQSIAMEHQPAAAPLPAQARPSVPLGLPFQPTPFLGRDTELTEIASLLGDPACRLLTLLGPGGIGKTRLAIEVAKAQTAVFADGVAFVSLASVSQPNQLVSAIGDILRLPLAGQSDATGPLLAYLRERHMLLVLDNFEHLLAGAELVSTLLAHAPRVAILVTSRERLNLQAEWLFDVDGLAYPAHVSLAPGAPQVQADPGDYSAVQMFVQRAMQVQPGFSLAESTLASITHICERVAGMPLAIELAAVGVRALPIGEIERRIAANLDTLATTLRDVPARHRSMRAVFDHSWSLLSEPERRLFSRLAVFRGGCTRDAAEQVASATSTALTTLVDKSLVRVGSDETRSIPGRPAPNSVPEPRFVMLEPIREYALDQLARSGEAEAVRQRHAHYFAALAEATGVEWGTPGHQAAIARLDRDHDNMRIALEWARTQGEGMQGLRLAEGLWRFWRSYGYASEGRVWLHQLLALDNHPTEQVAIAARRRGLHAAAWLASDQHDFATAAQLFEESQALGRITGVTEGETDLLINEARQARVAGQYQRATALLEDALSRLRTLSDHTHTAPATPELLSEELGQVLRELGLLLREQGDFVRPRELHEESMKLYRTSDNRAAVALSLLGLGNMARDRGDAAGVRRYCEPSLAIFRELGMQWAIGFTLNNLALLGHYEGDRGRAFDLANESVAIFRGLRADASLAEVLVTLGQIEQARGDRAAAYEAITEALRLARSAGPQLFVAAATERLGCLAAEVGKADLAVRLLGAAARLRRRMGTPTRPADQPDVERALAAARSSLGHGAFTAAWAAGEAPLEQVLNAIPGVAAFLAE